MCRRPALSAALAGRIRYALSRKRFAGSKTLFGLALVTLMVPAHILIVPLYLILRQAGLFDTYLALILPFAVTPIGIFMVKQYLGLDGTEMLSMNQS